MLQVACLIHRKFGLDMDMEGTRTSNSKWWLGMLKHTNKLIPRVILLGAILGWSGWGEITNGLIASS